MSITFTVPLGAFKRIAEHALRCVGTDRLMPVFTFVEFRASGGVLTATATDRYTIARAREAVEDLPDVTFYLAAQAVRLILATFKAPVSYKSVLTFTVADTTTVSGLLVANNSKASMTFDGLPGDWPKLDHLITPPAEPEPVLNPIFAAEFLRRLQPGRGPASDPVTMTRKGLVHGFYSDRWAIVIMAQRMPDGGADVLGGWAA